MRIPVVGVFYNETDQFHDWLASVEAQRSGEIEPVPVIVVSRHPQHVDALTTLIKRYIWKKRIDRRNVKILADNDGPTRAFNQSTKGFLERNGDCRWIASLDPDARFAPNALQQLVDADERGGRVGMVTPLVVKPRADRNFQRPIAMVETVCHAGHFPFQPTRPSSVLTNYWQSHFKDWTVEDVRAFLAEHPSCRPFTACFCASLWSVEMLNDIEFPCERQFRTLNCGEIGYRAQLRGWSGRFCLDAIAFHPNAPDQDYARNLAVTVSGSTAWHYYHAQGLIALKYFPDDLRNIAARRGDECVPWEYYFPDLNGVEPYMDNSSRAALLERWPEFDFRR